MKKIWMVGCVVLFLTGCNNQKTTSMIKDENTYYSYVDKISSDSIQKLDVSAELVNEYTPQYMKSISDAIVIGRVDSIDSADVKYNQVVGYTYGTMTIQNVLYGNMQVGDNISSLSKKNKYSPVEFSIPVFLAADTPLLYSCVIIFIDTQDGAIFFTLLTISILLSFPLSSINISSIL